MIFELKPRQEGKKAARIQDFRRKETDSGAGNHASIMEQYFQEKPR
jgi:hypothetical protein